MATFDPATDPETADSYAKAGAAAGPPLHTEPPPPPPLNLCTLACSYADFLSRSLPPRRRLLGTWLYAGDLGAIVASRGSGKTWVVQLIARALGTATDLGEWAAPDASLHVGIYDSEMPAEDLHERGAAVGLAEAGDRVQLLHYTAILNARQRPLNLANPDDQALLLAWAREASLDVLFIDNLTTSVSGVEENDNDGFREKIQPLLLAARAAGVTLILVGHLGRNGNWRGASAKEDLIDWTLKLERDQDSDDEHLIVKSSFGKFRRSRGGNGPLRWTLRANPGSALELACEPFQGMEAMVALVSAGVTSPRELAEELNVSGGTISKWGKKAIVAGRLSKTTRSEYTLPGDE